VLQGAIGMKPLPWSFTSLEDFVNCPRAFYEKRVVKSVVEAPSEAMLWGNTVHKAFEDRIKDGTPLPDSLQHYEPFMRVQAARPGITTTERKVALSRQLQPTSFFAKDVWFRGILDFVAVHDKVATIVDYKTGKPHDNTKQLKLFALWVFAQYPDINIVHTMYYWTQTLSTTSNVYTRDQIRDLWSVFLPHLQQYKLAFDTDTWQPRPSGLCNGWCPVTSCEFWRPMRPRR
jgi:hypothetical protein